MDRRCRLSSRNRVEQPLQILRRQRGPASTPVAPARCAGGTNQTGQSPHRDQQDAVVGPMLLERVPDGKQRRTRPLTATADAARRPQRRRPDTASKADCRAGRRPRTASVRPTRDHAASTSVTSASVAISVTRPPTRRNLDPVGPQRLRRSDGAHPHRDQPARNPGVTTGRASSPCQVLARLRSAAQLGAAGTFRHVSRSARFRHRPHWPHSPARRYPLAGAGCSGRQGPPGRVAYTRGVARRIAAGHGNPACHAAPAPAACLRRMSGCRDPRVRPAPEQPGRWRCPGRRFPPT